MKKLHLIISVVFALFLFTSTSLMAQWTSAPPNLWTNDNVGIGTSSANASLHVVRQAAGAVYMQEMILEAGAGAGIVFDKARGTIASRGLPLHGDAVGAFMGRIWTGSNYSPSAAIRFMVEGNATASSSSGSILFQTQPEGSRLGSTLEDRMTIRANGYVGIGTNNPTSLLAVEGKITAQEVEVTLEAAAWPDFVFRSDYDLMSLCELENYIAMNGHLPLVPSEADVMESGVNLGEMSALLLQKVEELTLYVIDLNKQNQELKNRIAELER